ncbi:MAG: hypothetical protein PQJ47_11315 [Sphaerochaetaceae bacterium]|nr:hypothetical protein [Sphaerochaetaceae bacterium]
MLLDMTISNYRSVQTPQTISFEAIKDNRLSSEKIVQVSERLNVIKSCAIIGPNGAGKSTFVRALEALKAIVTADENMECPVQLLAGTSFAYSDEKNGPSQMVIQIIMGKDEQTGQPLTGKYTLVASRDKIYEESYHMFVGRSRKLMFERKLIEPVDGDEIEYKYRWGKMFRGEKKRLVKKILPGQTYLAAAARKESLTLTPLYNWFMNDLMILPFGLSSSSERQIVDRLKAHPEWRRQLIDFLWSIDITDIRDVRIQDDRLIYIHTNVSQHYASYFNNESLSLRRLTTIALAMFESFIDQKMLVMDDFGMLLHPDALEHLVNVFEASNTKGSQMLVVDCNPGLLKDGVLRRDAVWFAQKNNVSATEYYSLANFKFSKSKKDLTRQMYLNGSFGALPITSEFTFVEKEKEA